MKNSVNYGFSILSLLLPFIYGEYYTYFSQCLPNEAVGSCYYVLWFHCIDYQQIDSCYREGCCELEYENQPDDSTQGEGR